MHDLLFTLPGDEFPFDEWVRVRAQDGSGGVVEFVRGDDRTQRGGSVDEIDTLLDDALERLVAPLQICRSCGEAADTAQFEVFERMHWICFHFEFEHTGFDRDQQCSAPGCPSIAT